MPDWKSKTEHKPENCLIDEKAVVSNNGLYLLRHLLELFQSFSGGGCARTLPSMLKLKS